MAEKRQASAGALQSTRQESAAKALPDQSNAPDVHIEERGTHDELIAMNRYYKKLVDMQKF